MSRLEPRSGIPATEAGAQTDASRRNTLDATARRHISLDDTLLAIAKVAGHEIPGADGVGLTLYGPDGIYRMVATAPFVSAVDRVQYGFGQGPCLLAAAEQRHTLSGELSDDPRWAMFGERVRPLGVRSALSLPLPAPTGIIGTLNVYAHGRDAFNDDSVVIGERYAGGAAIAIQHAVVLHAARELSVRIQTAFDERKSIEQAVGVLMVEDDIEADAARKVLSQLAAETSIPLAETAAAVIQSRDHV
jgi:GAF domain-containing protein